MVEMSTERGPNLVSPCSQLSPSFPDFNPPSERVVPALIVGNPRNLNHAYCLLLLEKNSTFKRWPLLCAVSIYCATRDTSIYSPQSRNPVSLGRRFHYTKKMRVFRSYVESAKILRSVSLYRQTVCNYLAIIPFSVTCQV